MTYAEWIQAYVVRNNHFVRGKCKEAVEEMVTAFPELRKAAGFAHTDEGEAQHWWCIAPDGEVIDPTRSQYMVVLEYEELDVNDPATRARVPIGKCANCGRETYEKDYSSEICSKLCADKYMAYLNAPEPVEEETCYRNSRYDYLED